MRPSVAIIVSLFSNSLCACSTYPLPQDVTGTPTEAIVKRVRCEARAAVRQATITAMMHYGDQKVIADYSGNDVALALSQKTDHFPYFNIDYFRDDVRGKLNYYKNTQVAYEFTMDLQENNKQGVGFDFARVINKRLDTVNFGFEGDRTRLNRRVFALMDTFENLALGIESAYCVALPTNVDFIYPINGSMPIYDLVSSYINTNELGILFGDKPGNLQGTDAKPAIPKMADTITFTTRLTGKINPNIGLAPLGPGFQLSTFLGTNESFREDKHSVILSVTTAPVKKKQNKGQRDIIINSTPETRAEVADKAIKDQRDKNFQEAVISISDSLSRISRSPF